MKYLFTHVRDKKNVPYATVAGTVNENGEVLLGWAICNKKKDRFSKKMGREVAAGRAEKVELTYPYDMEVVRALEDMRGRVLRYFRLDDYVENYVGEYYENI